MNNTSRELEIRKNETINLLQFIMYLDDGGVSSSDCMCDIMTAKTSMKANVIMMLYNAVEATVTQSLEKIHEVINGKNLRYDDLSDDLRKLMATFFGHSINKAGSVDNAMGFVLQFADFVNGNSNFNVTYNDLAKKYQLYSGNLDTREIINVLKKYGILFEMRCTELKTIREYRNQLAHGEQSFEEIGRNLSVMQLNEMVRRTYDYLEQMIDIIVQYLEEEKFKR